jgi:hypothetical protein
MMAPGDYVACRAAVLRCDSETQVRCSFLRSLTQTRTWSSPREHRLTRISIFDPWRLPDPVQRLVSDLGHRVSGVH